MLGKNQIEHGLCGLQWAPRGLLTERSRIELEAIAVGAGQGMYMRRHLYGMLWAVSRYEARASKDTISWVE